MIWSTKINLQMADDFFELKISVKMNEIEWLRI